MKILKICSSISLMMIITGSIIAQNPTNEEYYQKYKLVNKITPQLLVDDISIRNVATVQDYAVRIAYNNANEEFYYMTTGGNIVIPNDGNIGSAGDADAMAISSSGVVTFSQNPVFPDGGVPIADLDIDGGTDIGADLTTSDLIVVDDGAGGTNRKAALSRVVTLVQANIEDPTALAIALG